MKTQVEHLIDNEMGKDFMLIAFFIPFSLVRLNYV